MSALPNLKDSSSSRLHDLLTIPPSVCITSVLRITTLDIATSYLDITWNSIDSSKWTVIESNLGIICACLPALRRPLASLFPRLFGKFSRVAQSAAPEQEPRSHESHGRSKSSGKIAFHEPVSRFEVHPEGSVSQEQILPKREVSTGDGIRKTTHVYVQYDEFEIEGKNVVEMDRLGSRSS